MPPLFLLRNVVFNTTLLGKIEGENRAELVRAVTKP
nr:MAG TPA: hypothetical protein [Caudoviricetes sp.]